VPGSLEHLRAALRKYLHDCHTVITPTHTRHQKHLTSKTSNNI